VGFTTPSYIDVMSFDIIDFIIFSLSLLPLMPQQGVWHTISFFFMANSLWVNNIPLCQYTTFSLSIHLLMGT
jgi:hypothetical protein